MLIGNGLLTALSLFAWSFLMPTTPVPVMVAILFFGGLSCVSPPASWLFFKAVRAGLALSTSVS